MGRTKEIFTELRDDFINKCQLVEDGEECLLDTVIQMREDMAFYEEMIKNIKDFEAENYGEIETRANEYQNTYKGVDFEFRSGRRMFNYKGIPEWEEAKSKLKFVEDKYKAAWNNVSNGLMAVSEDGEELSLPDVTYGSKSVVIKKSKK